MRVIRVMCSGRVDQEFILRAFASGQDGVYIGGCRLGECNYTTQGNFDALGNVLMMKMIMEKIGLSPERLRIQFMSSADGGPLAEGINDFTKTVRELGPLGKGEGLDPGALKFKLEALRKLVPYIRLVERERLRVPEKTEQAYRDFYASDEVTRMVDELVVQKLAVSEIVSLLEQSPLSTGDIAERLGLKPSEAAKHINSSTRQGLIRYDPEQKCYALA
jgi:coenzyme F420-reducing hydrogenase delta subunit